ncbi:VWA domain-containing protein [Maribacter luteus]|uniref:VWA domain-containing protein n=1 Tax=Maribacter luteus TaxID=2594478 RepID=A0A6I2MN97_9FLAO|nr:VWA domain-containing protein [Maribacter luteus]MRX63950.1 VWA domain-containing protein [Maribacter luteus]
MQTTTVLAITLAAIAALLLVFFQYYYKSELKGKLRFWLSLLRFIAIFGTLLLLVNPKFIKKDFFLEKSNLIVLVDNSSSINNTIGEGHVNSSLENIKGSTELAEKFNLHYYKFGKETKLLDSLDFNEKVTDISKSLKTLNTIFGHSESGVVLLSDGNATLGEDYEFYGRKQKLPIFPIVLGDTTHYEDLKIVQINSNKYAFLKNKFPVEIFVSYEGNNDVKSLLNVTMNGKNVHSQRMDLSNKQNSKSVTVLLNAATVGLKTLRVSLESLENEKNIVNNTKNIAIEVIDEKTNVAIVSDIIHPDIGVLKKSIESNEQRSVTIINPKSKDNDLKDIDLMILYQPTPTFQGIYDLIAKSNIPTFTITGPKTNWSFLNKVQNSFTKNSFGQSEEVIPSLNNSFGKFILPEIQFENFPPLETNLGETMIIKSHEVLLSQIIKGNDIGEPLLALLDMDKRREAVLFGENIWKWRVQNYRERQNFEDFDELIGKIIFYLSISEPKNRLVLNYESFYDQGKEAKISVTYFDESFTFDPNAQITLELKRRDDGTAQEFPMLLKGRSYEADLNNLSPGEYDFTVKVIDGNLMKSGRFSIMDYNVEQQFTTSDQHKLKRLADETGGSLFYPSEIVGLIGNLKDNAKFKPVQKSNQNVVSLVDFRFLLGIIIAALAIEWIIRKYNGLT